MPVTILPPGIANATGHHHQDLKVFDYDRAFAS
jgi:hypothetical protein